MITLPATPGPVALEWHQIDFGGTLTPPLGGSDQRLNRLGNRLMVMVTMPPMIPVLAGPWVAALNRGLREGVRWGIRQVGLTITATNASVYGSGQSGQSLQILTDVLGYAAIVTPGQTLTLVSAATGRRYNHLIYSAAQNGGADIVLLGIDPPLRLTPTHGDTVLITQPTIEGLLQGDGVSWSIGRARRYGLDFTIRERA